MQSETSVAFPFEIIVEILLLLDLKSLSRCRCVSKSWHAIISHPTFKSLSKQDKFILISTNQCITKGCFSLHIHSFHYNTGTLTEIASFDTRIRYLRSVSTATGYVGLCARSGGPVYIVNPFARELVNISSQSDGFVAFGYISSTRQYKMLRVDNYYFKKSEPGCFCGPRASVICIGKDLDWRPVENPPFLVDNNGQSVAVVNGFVHLLRLYDMKKFYGDGIARFDLEKEKWSTFSLPHFVSEKTLLPNLVLREFEGRLCLIDREYRGQQNEKMINIWLLEDYDANEWIKLYTINLSSFSKSLTKLDVFPLVRTEDERLLLQMRETAYEPIPQDWLQLYDPKTESFEDQSIKEKLSIRHSNLWICNTIYSPGPMILSAS